MYLQLSFHLQCAYLVSDAEARLKGKKKKEREKGKNEKGENHSGGGCYKGHQPQPKGLNRKQKKDGSEHSHRFV